MTPSEFKSWFEGFTESMDGPPSLKQWERIQARVKEISEQPVTERHYIDRYWPSVRPYWVGPNLQPFNGPTWLQNGIGVSQATALLASQQSVGGAVLNAGSCEGQVGNVAFDSHAAMNALGKADAASLAA